MGKRAGRSGAPLLGLLLFCGCVPWPHFDRDAPRVQGIVSRDGAPAPAVRVFLYPRCDPSRTAPPCSSSRVETSTDEQGRFAFKEASTFRLFARLGDPIYCWEVCVERDGAPREGLRVVDLGAPAPEDRLQCDLVNAAPGASAATSLCACTMCQLAAKRASASRPRP